MFELLINYEDKSLPSELSAIKYKTLRAAKLAARKKLNSSQGTAQRGNAILSISVCRSVDQRVFATLKGNGIWDIFWYFS